jgi:hypothetical protein
MATSRLGFAGEDVVTLLRLLGRGRFVVVNRPLFHYRVRRPISRETEPILAYAWKRIAMDTVEHRGNLLLLLQRNHVYHANLRSVIREEAPLSPQVRLALWLALLIREFWVPLTLLPPAAARELGLLGLRPPARPKTV